MNILNQCFAKCKNTVACNNENQKLKIPEEAELIQNKIEISRPVFTEPNFKKIYHEEDFQGVQLIKEVLKKLDKNFGHGWKSVSKNLNNRLPCIEWIRNYDFRENFLSDVLAGLIVGCTHIPQGILIRLVRYLNFFKIKLKLYLYRNGLCTISHSTTRYFI